MQNKKVSDATATSPPKQFSLQSAMIALTAACIALAVGRLLWPHLPRLSLLIDVRLIPFAVAVGLLAITGGRVTRGVAIGGIAGLCLGCGRFNEARWPLYDQVFSLLATGAFGAWLGGALHAAKLGYNRTALAAILALFGFGLLIFG